MDSNKNSSILHGAPVGCSTCPQHSWLCSNRCCWLRIISWRDQLMVAAAVICNLHRALNLSGFTVPIPSITRACLPTLKIHNHAMLSPTCVVPDQCAYRLHAQPIPLCSGATTICCCLWYLQRVQ